MSRTEQDKRFIELSDEMDEARSVAKHYRLIWLSIVLGELLAVALMTVGCWIGAWGSVHHVDTGGQAGLLIASGILGGIGTAIFGFWWFIWNNGYPDEQIPSPADRTRTAERAYRNHIMEQA